MKPSEVCYADDCDFISDKTFPDKTKTAQTRHLEPILGNDSLYTNKDKTEYTTLKRDNDRSNETWRNAKKVDRRLGSLIGDAEDVK